MDRLREVVERSELWTRLDVVAVTASTNADVSAAAAAGAPEGLVVVAEQQRGGRGRLGRTWESPARASVLMSVLLRPEAPPSAVPASALPLVPLLTGLAVVEAVRSVADVSATLKWPNDLIVTAHKLGGILVERTVDAALIVGVGVNVTTRAAELPNDVSTSLAIAGGGTDREPLVKEILRALARRYVDFRGAGGASQTVVPAYREVCETIGRDVVLHLPGGATVRGTAVDVNDAGMLVIDEGSGQPRSWSAGDVVHVRAAT